MIQKMSKKLNDPEKQKQLKMFGIIIGLLILFVGLYVFVNKPCFIENSLLLEQQIIKSDLCNEDKCLFIKVQPLGDENNYSKTLYFSNDTLTLEETRGFRSGEVLKMQWCKIPNGEYRIRGIERAE